MGGQATIGVLFSQPLNKPLTAAGQFQQCYLTFYNAATNNTILPVYRDAQLQWPHKQYTLPGGYSLLSTVTGVKSDATGLFDPIYLDPSLTYTYSLYSAAGVLLETAGANSSNVGGINVANPYETSVAVKYGDTSRSSQSTLLNDPALQINIPNPPLSGAPATYRIEADLQFLSASGTQTVNLEIAYSGTVNSISPSLVFYGIAADSFVQNGAGLNVSAGILASSVSAQNLIKVVGTARFTTSGTLSIKWCQNTSSSTPLTLKAGSALYATLQTYY